MERSVLLNAVVKKYDETFKRHAVEMVLHGGKSVKQAAEELGVSQYSIYEWKKKFFPQAPLPGFAGKKPVSAGLTQDVEARGFLRKPQRLLSMGGAAHQTERSGAGGPRNSLTAMVVPSVT